jgi:hypothetical protein
MPAFEAIGHADGTVEILTIKGRFWLTEELNRCEQVLARLILSLWARLAVKQ